jgi:hypothetical protein
MGGGFMNVSLIGASLHISAKTQRIWRLSPVKRSLLTRLSAARFSVASTPLFTEACIILSVMQKIIERKVYRGFISSVGNLATVAGNNGGSNSKGERSMCPFCASPLQKFLVKSLSLPKGTPADFRVCGAGHLVGLIERVVQEEEYSDSDSDWDSDIVIDMTEPWMPPP